MDTKDNKPQNEVLMGLLSSFDEKELGTMIDLLKAYKQAAFPGTYDDNTDMEQLAADTLREIGVQAHLVGHKYLVTALVAVTQDKTLLESMTKGLYPFVAAKHDTTPYRVERGIRHAIEKAWDLCSTEDVREKFFGNTISHEKGKPTNSQFIAELSKHMQSLIDK